MIDHFDIDDKECFLFFQKYNECVTDNINMLLKSKK